MLGSDNCDPFLEEQKRLLGSAIPSGQGTAEYKGLICAWHPRFIWLRKAKMSL